MPASGRTLAESAAMANDGPQTKATLMLTPDELERYARHIVLREVGGPGPGRAQAARACW